MPMEIIATLFLVSLGSGVLLFLIIYLAAKPYFTQQEQAKAYEEAFQKQHPHFQAESFYKECLKAGVINVEGSANIARIKLCAKNQSLNLNEEEAIKFYLLGKSEVERIDREKREEERNNLIREEKQVEYNFDLLNQNYAKLYGQEKTIAMCTQMAHKALREFNNLEDKEDYLMNAKNNIYNSHKQIEGDWAIFGGMASALGGTAAGISTALEIQQRNAEARVHNTNLDTSLNAMIGPLLMDNLLKKSDAQKEAKRWETIVERAKILLVDDCANCDLLEKISPTLKEQIRSETGAVYISVNICKAKGLKIFGTVNAVVDGSIKAILWDNGIRIGEAIIPLPYKGADRKQTITGICRSPSLKDKVYDVTFETNRLWAIEVLNTATATTE